MARYIIVVEPLGDDLRPAAVRLRAALKHMLRACRLRCITITEHRTADPDQECGGPHAYGDHEHDSDM